MKNASRHRSNWFGSAALVCFWALGLLAPVAQAADEGSRFSAARAAERMIFNDRTLSPHFAAYAIEWRMVVLIGEPERQDDRHEALIEAAQNAEPIPASALPAMLDGLQNAYRNHSGRTITITDEEGEERRQFLSGLHQFSGKRVVTSNDDPSDHGASSPMALTLPGDHNTEKFIHAHPTRNDNMLVGVRIHGARMSSEERLERSRELGPRPYAPSYPLLRSRAAFLEDGQALVVMSEYQSDLYGLPIRTIVIVECKRVLVEDLHYALVEFDADTDFARMLSRFRTDAPMTGRVGFRHSLMLAAMDARRDGTLSVISSGRARLGAADRESYSLRTQGRTSRNPFEVVRRGARNNPMLKLDLGLGEGPQQVEIPELTRTKVRSDRGISWQGSPTGDLRVLLTGSDGDRRRAILCLQIGEFELD